MRILGIIPARGGSKGIPDKNIKLLGEKPLLQYSFEAAQNSRLITKIILSSDSDKIIEVGKNIGMEVPFKRPMDLAKDDTPTLSVVQHSISFFLGQNENFDAVCLLQPTTPLRSKELIDTSIDKFISGNYDSLISVREVPHEYNPHWVFEEKDGALNLVTGDEAIIPRRQNLPKAYHRDGAIYITKTETLMKENSLYGKKIGFIENSDPNYVNIDTMEDWIIAENILNAKV